MIAFWFFFDFAVNQVLKEYQYVLAFEIYFDWRLLHERSTVRTCEHLPYREGYWKFSVRIIAVYTKNMLQSRKTLESKVKRSSSISGSAKIAFNGCV